MIKKFKKVPSFKNEIEEAKFWLTHDTVDYVDWSKAVVNPVFPNLKRSTESISIRLPASTLSNLKMIANNKDVPYQSLIKVYLAEIVKRELGKISG